MAELQTSQRRLRRRLLAALLLGTAVAFSLWVGMGRAAAAPSPTPTPAPSPAPTATPPPPPLANSLPVHAMQCANSAAAGGVAGATLGPVGMALSFGLAAAFDGSCWAMLGDVISAGFGAAANAAIGAVAQWVTDGAANASTLLLTSLQHQVGSPDLHAPWFTSLYYGYGANGPSGPGALTVAAWILGMVLTGGVLVCLIRGDLGGMLRLLTLRLPVAIFVTYIAIWLVTALLSLTDTASAWMLQRGVNSLDQWVGMLDMQAQGNSIGTDLLTVLGCLLLLFGTLLAYVELLARSAGIYIVTAFIPLIAAASLWPGARSALKKGAETLFVLGVAKFVMVFVLVLGAAALVGGSDLHDYSALLNGVLIFLIAALAPGTIFKLVPILEGAAVGALAGGAAGWAMGHAAPLVGGATGGVGSRARGLLPGAAGSAQRSPGAAGGSPGDTASIGAGGSAARPQSPPAGGGANSGSGGGSPTGGGDGPTLAGSGGGPRRSGGGGAAAKTPADPRPALTLAGSNGRPPSETTR